MHKLKEFSKNLIENSTIATFAIDLEHTVVFWNKACEQLTGIMATEIIGTNDHWQAFYKAKRPCLSDLLVDGKAGELSSYYEVYGESHLIPGGLHAEGWHLDIGGMDRYLVFEAAPLYDNDGRITAVFEMLLDITEHKRAEEDLKNERNFNSAVLDTVSALVVVLDRRGRIVRFNRACEETTGYTFDEVQGEYVFDVFLLPEEAHAVRRVFSELTAGHFPNCFENYWRTKDGGRRLISWHNTALTGPDGEVQWVIATGIDITESRNAEEELRFKSLLLDNATDSVFVHDFDGKFIYVNEAGYKARGYTKEELLGMSLAELNHSDSAKEIQSRMELLRKMGSATFEAIHIKKDGTPMDLEVHSHIVEFEGREVVIGIGRDITERKKAESLLKESEERYRRLVEASPVGIAVHSDGKFIYVNGAAAALFGASSKDELIGKPIVEFVHPDYREFVQGRVGQLLAEKEVSLAEEKFIRLDGRVIDVEVTASHVVYDGKPAIQVVVRDITEQKRAADVLRESEERYRSIINGAAEGFWLIDPELKTIEVNAALCSMLEYTRDEMLGKRPFDFVDEENLKIFKEQTSKIPGTTQRHYDIVLKAKSGRDVYTRFNATTVRDSDGNPVSSFAFVTNITELKLAQNALLEAKERVEQLYRVIPSAIFTVDTDAVITGFNDKAAEITGYAPEEAIGSRCTLFALDPCTGRCGLFSSDTKKPIIGRECRIRRKDGQVRVLSKNVDLIYDIEGNIIGGVESFEDITERKHAEEMLNYMAYYDPLTDLPNRVLLNDRLELALANAHRNKHMMAVLFLDLDSFKTINDSLGHSVGDLLLQGVAERLKRCLREGDTIARLGGDEFTLLLPRIESVEDAITVAKKVLEALRPAFNFSGSEFHITTSIGISLYPNDGTDAQSLLKNADIALYRAKEQGRDNYQLYTPAMNARAFERLALESSMRKALKRQEFKVYYQPQVALGSGNIVGMEALIRWQHPDLGLVYPADFIPVAEETGLIVPIGEFVIRTACAQGQAWRNAGFQPMRIAVNLSARQFQQQGLVEMIEQVLDETGLNPRYLDLEITESILMEDADTAVTLLRKLKEIGIQISIDDFGTGYSSLSYLKRFPIDTLKIDRSFIHDVTIEQDDAAIATAIISLAHSLNLRAIAEGVETTDQIEFLRALDCDEMQGYVFSHPLSAEEATELLLEEARRCA